MRLWVRGLGKIYNSLRSACRGLVSDIPPAEMELPRYTRPLANYEYSPQRLSAEELPVHSLEHTLK